MVQQIQKTGFKAAYERANATREESSEDSLGAAQKNEEQEQTEGEGKGKRMKDTRTKDIRAKEQGKGQGKKSSEIARREKGSDISPENRVSTQETTPENGTAPEEGTATEPGTTPEQRTPWMVGGTLPYGKIVKKGVSNVQIARGHVMAGCHMYK